MKINTVIFTNDSTESTPTHFLNFRHIIYKENKTIKKRHIEVKKKSQGNISKCHSQLLVQSPFCCFESPLYIPTRVKSLGNIIWQFKMMLAESRIDLIYAFATSFMAESAFFAVLSMIDLVGLRSDFGKQITKAKCRRVLVFKSTFNPIPCIKVKACTFSTDYY